MEAIDLYGQHQAAKGNRARSIAGNQHALRRFLQPVIRQQLAKVSAGQGAALYERIRTEPGKHGRPLSVDAHRDYLSIAKAMLGWCVKQGWLRENPLASVEPMGRRRRGREQLRINEARSLWAAALAHAQESDAPVTVLVALGMGLRAGEIVSRTVRDVDDGGRILWVDYTADGFAPKSESSRRPVQVPEEIQPLLLRLCRDKTPAAHLWPSDDGGQRQVRWVTRNLERLCAAAGVPRVCAHSLRGLQATIALQAGATPHQVAAVLGHSSSAITLRHYAAPGSKDQGEQIARVLTLRGPKA